MGTRSVRRECLQLARWAHANAATAAFGGAPFGAAERVKGAPMWVQLAHANATTGAFGGALSGATKTSEGCAECGAVGACGRSHKGPSVELHAGPRNVRGMRRKGRKELL